MLAFGAALPTIRARVNADLARADHSRETVLAIVVRLLEATYSRIGNEEYARKNGSFGLTTLRNKHVGFSGDSLRLQFVGKRGKSHSIRVTDRRLARVVWRCRELPGQSLFQYRDDGGDTRAIDSTEVNDHIAHVPCRIDRVGHVNNMYTDLRLLRARQHDLQARRVAIVGA